MRPRSEADRRHDDALDERRDDLAERGTDDHADGEIDDVAACDELAEFSCDSHAAHYGADGCDRTYGSVAAVFATTTHDADDIAL